MRVEEEGAPKGLELSGGILLERVGLSSKAKKISLVYKQVRQSMMR